MYKGKNLAQLIYRMSRGVVPAGIHPFDAEAEKLVAEGMKEELARKVTDQAETLFLHSYQWDLPWPDDEEAPLPDEEAERITVMPETETDPVDTVEADEDGEDLAARYEALAEELKNAKRENKMLREALTTERRTAGEKLSAAESELRSLRMEHRELEDLRELLFNQENHVREVVDEKITFPAEVRKRTVVFGGHDSFLREIKQKLPNVRFVDVDKIAFSPELIRNAEVVWIQNNCIGHSQFNNIARQARQYGVQMRYFAWASAEKCAEQVVKEDAKDG